MRPIPWIALSAVLSGCTDPAGLAGAPKLAPSSGDRLQVHFDAQGAHLGAPSAPALSVVGLDGERLAEASPRVVPCAGTEPCRSRLTWDHGGLESWWLQSGDALQQGFTLHEVAHDTTTITLALPGGSVQMESPTQAWLHTGEATYSYRGLMAWDATGRTLPASMLALDDQLVIDVDTRGAVAPVVVDPILDTPIWKTPVAGAVEMAGALDLNNDGYDDAVVSLARTHPDAGTNGGLGIFLGSDTGLAPTPALVIDFLQTHRISDEVAAVGDLNNDGIDDVAWVDSREGPGAVHVLFGVDGGPLSNAVRWRYENANSGDTTFGTGLAGGGDLNADGIDDLVVGSAYNPTAFVGAGEVLVFFGGEGGPAAAPDQVLRGSKAKEGYGYALAILDHPSPSHRDELIVGCWHDPSTHVSGGTVYRHASTSSGVTSTGVKLTPVGKPANSWWGFQVASAGDTNGDGFTDALVGDIRWSLRGNALLYLGTAGTVSTTPAWYGQPSDIMQYARLGYDLGGVGDLDGDGYGEVLVSAHQWDSLENNGGKVFLFRGSPSGLEAEPAWTRTGDVQFGTLGLGSTAAGDTDGDGLLEVLISWPGWKSSSSHAAGQLQIHESANPDIDGDGDPNDTDCAPNDPSIFTGAEESCDGVDEDCDGVVDNGFDQQEWYADGDGDGAGAGARVLDCRDLPGHSHTDDDCDDTDPSVNAGATEVCNDIDDDCDEAVDDDDDDLDASDGIEVYVDEDGDTYGAIDPSQACEAGPGRVLRSGDCDDTDPDVKPNATEVCNGVDDDCDDKVDDDDDSLLLATRTDWFPDTDSDGFGDADGTPTPACAAPEAHTADDTDCDDTRAATNPDAPEQCTGLDDDCDTLTDDADPSLDLSTQLSWWLDGDGDGVGAGDEQRSCALPSNGSPESGDCDDTRASVNPGAPEVCGGLDDDCDTLIDDDDPSLDLASATTWWPDTDGDGFGDEAGASTTSCTGPDGAVANDEDCDDSTAAIAPSEVEQCNDIDDDCDGLTDDEVVFSDWYLDGDGDGAGAGEPVNACAKPEGRTLDGSDCDDDEPSIHPGATEVCNGDDDDCDGVIDEEVLPTWYADEDGDGFGEAPLDQCTQPEGYLAQDGDCDDEDPYTNPEADERCNGRDDDCNGLIDANDPSLPGDCNLTYVAGGCSCSTGGSPSPLWLALMPLAVRRRR